MLLVDAEVAGTLPVASVHVICAAMPSGGREKRTSTSISHFSGFGMSTSSSYSA